MIWLIERLKEPSTWASIAALLALLGVKPPSTTWELIAQAGVAAAGLLGVVLQERTPSAGDDEAIGGLGDK